jgi:hypothetical protein
VIELRRREIVLHLSHSKPTTEKPSHVCNFAYYLLQRIQIDIVTGDSCNRQTD